MLKSTMEIKCCVCGEEPKRKLADGYQGFFHLCSDQKCEIELMKQLHQNDKKPKK
jgi:hypothetical protein